MLGACRTTIVVAMKGRTRSSRLRVHQTMRGNGRWRIRNAVGLVLAFVVMVSANIRHGSFAMARSRRCLF